MCTQLHLYISRNGANLIINCNLSKLQFFKLDVTKRIRNYDFKLYHTDVIRNMITLVKKYKYLNNFLYFTVGNIS